MNGSCAVCWGEMGAPLPRVAMRLLGAGPPGPPAPVDAHAPGKALPCGHAFHTACIRRWLTQCHGCAPARPSLAAVRAWLCAGLDAMLAFQQAAVAHSACL